jgi:hypothetical protein
MRNVAPQVIGIALGFIAAIASFPYLNRYMLAIFALIVAVCIGFVVFVVVERIVRSLIINP